MGTMTPLYALQSHLACSASFTLAKFEFVGRQQDLSDALGLFATRMLFAVCRYRDHLVCGTLYLAGMVWYGLAWCTVPVPVPRLCLG